MSRLQDIRTRKSKSDRKKHKRLRAINRAPAVVGDLYRQGFNQSDRGSKTREEGIRLTRRFKRRFSRRSKRSSRCLKKEQRQKVNEVARELAGTKSKTRVEKVFDTFLEVHEGRDPRVRCPATKPFRRCGMNEIECGQLCQFDNSSRCTIAAGGLEDTSLALLKKSHYDTEAWKASNQQGKTRLELNSLPRAHHREPS